MAKYSVGVDIGAGDDHTSVVVFHTGKRGIVYVDEMMDWPDYKWYRNPIKWWKWRRMMKIIDRHTGEFTLKGKND